MSNELFIPPSGRSPLEGRYGWFDTLMGFFIGDENYRILTDGQLDLRDAQAVGMGIAEAVVLNKLKVYKLLPEGIRNRIKQEVVRLIKEEDGFFKLGGWGKGYDAGDTPVRIQGPWSINDLKQGLLGHPPRGLEKPDVHHGGQMPGAAKHEVIPSEHRNNSALHKNKYNQGVTPEMRTSDRELHWWYRAREQGADDVLPDWIYNK